MSYVKTAPTIAGRERAARVTLAYCRMALRFAKIAGSPKVAARLRATINSAEGAARHAALRRFK